MDLGGPPLADDRRVAGRDVADVRGETVLRIERSQPPHRPVADDLGDDGRSRNRRALLVAVDDRSMLGRGRPEPEAVDETDLGGRRELPEDRPHRGEV